MQRSHRPISADQWTSRQSSVGFDFGVFDQENHAKGTIYPVAEHIQPSEAHRTTLRRSTHPELRIIKPQIPLFHVGQQRVNALNMTRAEERHPALDEKRPRRHSRSSSRKFNANNRSNSSVAASIGSRRRSPQREREFVSQIPGLLTLDQRDLSVAATVDQQPSPASKRDFISQVPGLLTLKRAPVVLVTLPATLSETLAPASNKEFQSPDTGENTGRSKRRRSNEHEVFTDVSLFASEQTGEWRFLAEQTPQGGHEGVKQTRTASVQADVAVTPVYGTYPTRGKSARMKPSAPEDQSSKPRPRKVRNAYDSDSKRWEAQHQLSTRRLE